MARADRAVTLVIPFDPVRLSPNTPLHWRERARRVKRVHEAARLAWLCAGSPVIEDHPVEVSHIIRRGVKMDPDNALAACKNLNDSLLCRNRRRYGVVADDDASRVRYAPVRFETGRRWKGREEVQVTITPLEVAE